MPGELDAICRDGWVVVDTLFSGSECRSILAADARRTHPQVNRELIGFATDARWADLAVTFLGPEVRLLREQVLTKQPHSDGVVPWHQDHGFLATRPAGFLTCIVALDEVTGANGCLVVLPGSHHRGPVPHVPAGAILRADADLTDAVEVPVRLALGSVLALSSVTLHRSGPNRTDGWRPTWLVQFCASDTVDARTGAAFEGCPVVAAAGEWRPLRRG